ncbi:hypothetical protein AXE80_10715 [Wenyingzhuangia fucanilytica]|uniref:Uncharacterized protein n=1 Tax=Wenyingzhuangia fucanilytica TaxID=1790137 RepID=A0A1B1Y7H1_9FLAO|nr:hypothetical protein [Wenyingzhuangia fucanilytica]ANW96715.1 hypothetical protein AXE80_10715 [Wenyingzhuangia fucanilytica]
MTAKEKLRKVADYKGVTPRNLSIQLGASDSYLRTNGAIYSDMIPVVRKVLPFLNMDWFLYDEGDMIKKESLEVMEEEQEPYLRTEKVKKEEDLKTLQILVETQKQNLIDKEKLIAVYEKMLGITDNEESSKAS